MENTEGKIKSFEKISRMLVIKPANDMFSQFSDMVIDDIKVNYMKYHEDEGLYYIGASVNFITSLYDYQKMKNIIHELCHMFLNAAEYVFLGNFDLRLKFRFEVHELHYSFSIDGDRQGNSVSLDSIKYYLE